MPRAASLKHRDVAAGASPAAYNFSFLSKILQTSGSAGPALSAHLVPTLSGNCPVNAFPLTIQQCQGCPPNTAGAAAVPAAVKACAKYPSLFFFHLNSHRLSLHNTVTQGYLAHTGLCVLVCICLLIHTGQPFHLHLFYSSTAGLLGFFFLNLLLSQTLYFQRSAAHAFIRVCGQQVDVLVLLQTTS